MVEDLSWTAVVQQCFWGADGRWDIFHGSVKEQGSTLFRPGGHFAGSGWVNATDLRESSHFRGGLQASARG
ncbi:hypothetical protein [Kibdelosporangium philippinense]|uniref:hypothetical protein n=1 Tax=Kibdelosporangium philippinense TaxID=211113 RepID=UPI003615D87C